MARPDSASIRRSSLALLALWLGCLRAHAAGFGFEDVAARAAELARAPYRAPAAPASALDGIDYDAYRDIRFRPERAHWRERGLPFELMFFHAGAIFTQPIKVHEIAGGAVHPIEVPRSAFDYGRNVARVGRRKDGNAELAGFRVHYPLNRADYKDEVVVFLGASYFRALGAGQLYGLSARGIGIDSSSAGGEEFPAFESFWIEQPARDAKELVVHALLNGPRATGAYRFAIRPGTDTVVDVRARLYLRAGVATLGIAPLTSMFLGGENQPRGGDFRPEVHDSDGLQIEAANGEWIWRPLVNPARPFVTSFALDGVKGFGLMQRDRAFASYEDTEALYERRPSAWIVPKGDWGAGRVELLSLPSDNEYTDNVVAYWVPARSPSIGVAFDLAYEMRWQGDGYTRAPAAWTRQSRRGSGHEPARDGELQFQIDFEGPALAELPAEADVEAIVSSDDNARVSFVKAYRHPARPGWRTTLKVQRRSAAKPVELRVFLRHRNHVLTETWSYAVPPS